METKPRKPFVSLGKNVLFTSISFIVFLCFVLSFVTYRVYTSALYERYQKQLTSIVDYVEVHIDKDDMGVCARTYVESEKYKEFQAFFDEMIDNYSDVHYLYIIQVLEPGTKEPVVEICAANSTYEKENTPETVLHLGDSGEDWYPEDVVEQFREIQNGDVDVFLENDSDYGVDYTLARPLISSDGDHYAMLCADVDINELNAVVYRNIYINILAIILCGILFVFLLVIWLRSNVTDPIKSLQKSVTDFASKTAGKHDPDELLFYPPDLKVNNEISVLSDSVNKLSKDMRDYVQEIVAAESANKDLKDHVSEMNMIVYKDSLTNVGNKAAYDKAVQGLQESIKNDSAEFAILMMDVNYLKHINDTYGHEHGDQYIIGSCRTACQVFKHSPVFRIGGDEFVIILKGDDYKNRDELFNKLNEQFENTSHDETIEPWLRYSMAIGMSAYEKGDDVDSVFNRADKNMYKAKAEFENGS
ncbi:MAG: GGDEF domain-containing protein [Erysipelotrichaceae bacterium]|nr:GGDEF domain-containing protein [Erysipelotrichaceae bacterium]